jgi:hypothetical protein
MKTYVLRKTPDVGPVETIEFDVFDYDDRKAVSAMIGKNGWALVAIR